MVINFLVLQITFLTYNSDSLQNIILRILTITLCLRFYSLMSLSKPLILILISPLLIRLSSLKSLQCSFSSNFIVFTIFISDSLLMIPVFFCASQTLHIFRFQSLFKPLAYKFCLLETK